MGCDIHLYVERRDPDERTTALEVLGGAIWKFVPPKSPWAVRHSSSVAESREWQLSRNYTLFATLAGVRAYSDSLPAIAKPRGMPWDASPEVNACDKEWGRDGHSHSWLTLAELQAFDWDQTTEVLAASVANAVAGTPKTLAYWTHEFQEMMKDLTQLGPEHCVRIVFFFDN